MWRTLFPFQFVQTYELIGGLTVMQCPLNMGIKKKGKVYTLQEFIITCFTVTHTLIQVIYNLHQKSYTLWNLHILIIKTKWGTLLQSSNHEEQVHSLPLWTLKPQFSIPNETAITA